MTLESLSPFLWRAPPLEMRRECGKFFPDHVGKRIPPLELGGGNGAPLDVGGTLVLPLEWRRERNPERPESNSHGDWPFLRPPERVPEVPVISREHLPQLEKIQEVLPSRRDEAQFG